MGIKKKVMSKDDIIKNLQIKFTEYRETTETQMKEMRIMYEGQLRMLSERIQNQARELMSQLGESLDHSTKNLQNVVAKNFTMEILLKEITQELKDIIAKEHILNGHVKERIEKLIQKAEEKRIG